MRFAFVFVLSIAMVTVSLHAGAAVRPSIVVFLCDDLGYGDLECYGHPHIKTPHLDRLAADGMRFTDFYSAAPVCSPSRVGLLTGRSPNRAGVYDWIPPARRPRPDAREQVHMRAGEVTIAALLRGVGYRTCLAGKWHCNSAFNSPKQPQPGDFGFEHWFATQNNAAPSHESPRNYVRGGEAVGPLEGYSCQLAVDEAIGWLDREIVPDTSRPFFVYLPFHEPHEPVASPPDLVQKYQGVARTPDEAQYFANVANVDAAVGRFIAALEKRKLRENTLIIFTSDNGPETLRRYRGAHRSYGRPGPLRGMKLHTHEAGFRVAGIVNWKGRVQPGQIIRTPVSSLDFLPTFCELARVKPPRDRALDGLSFLPLLDGKELKRTKPLVWCYYNGINEARVAMRDGRWKVLARLDGGDFQKLQNVTTETIERVRAAKLSGFEIYDVTRDAGEANDLADSRPELLAALRARLETHYRELLSDSYVWTPAASAAR